MTSSYKKRTKDQGPESIQFLSKKEIVFFSKAADQRPRTRIYSFPRMKWSSSQKQQTKDQGPDPIQFLFKEKN
jgi:hypothetical protein